MRFLDAGDDCSGSFVYKSSSLLSVKPWGEHATGQAASFSESTAMRLPTRFGCIARLASSAACARFGQRAAMWRVGVCRVHRLFVAAFVRRFKGFAVHCLRLGA